ncbi:PRKR-interacting protein 1 [Nothoprocta perdicaria]|uniref:PRKR-interacting protein 1 n=1 Tax=Nothoprocta perdicaria TaxID=30464 RepID=UPI000E1B9936|nr:PRKR-interacting protein 1 [Nothoprocta perdicaria]
MAAPSAPGPSQPREGLPALFIPRTAAEEQRVRLERLMRNPEKTVLIPEKLNEWAPRPPPEFVRDVMGSSAGAGSGEFHVYRHLRRREYQRQDFMDAMAEKQKLDEEFQKKLERNKMIAEEQTAKRRRKRQKLKEKKLQAKKNKLEQKKQEKESDQSQERASSKEDEEDSKEEEEEKEDDAEELSFVMGRG